ncbi:MAG: hypothetical protein ACK566_01580 [Bacteroidota bacterium]
MRNAELNPFGPVQLYTPPVIPPVLSVTFDPMHAGPVFSGLGVSGSAFTETEVFT